MRFHYHEKQTCSKTEYDTYNLAKINLDKGHLYVYCRDEVLPDIERLVGAWVKDFEEKLETPVDEIEVEVFPLVR